MSVPYIFNLIDEINLNGGSKTPGAHMWNRDVDRSGNPILTCARCPVVWRPDQHKPRKPCRTAKSDAPGGAQ
jgi:hypothetical protein